MMMTAQQREAEYADRYGNCEFCGTLVPEDELNHLTWRDSEEMLCCEGCYTDPPK